jgi:hypothetical protein
VARLREVAEAEGDGVTYTITDDDISKHLPVLLDAVKDIPLFAYLDLGRRSAPARYREPAATATAGAGVVDDAVPIAGRGANPPSLNQGPLALYVPGSKSPPWPSNEPRQVHALALAARPAPPDRGTPG